MSAFEEWWYDYRIKNGIHEQSVASQNKREAAFHGWNAALAHAEKDAARLAWCFARMKSDGAFLDMLQPGMRADYTLDQWRSHIDSAIASERDST